MKQTPELDRPYLPNDYVRAIAGVDVQGIVFVEVDAAPADQKAEAHFVQEQARFEPRLRAMVVSIPLELGGAAEPYLIEYEKLPLARGVRRLIERHQQQPGWALAEDFVAGVKLLPKFNFTFDLCLFHPQLAEVTELVRRCPEVSFAVDHIAKPGIRAGLRQPWSEDLLKLARLPNVWCKISGVVTEADHANWTEDVVGPYIAHAIDCFGFERVMFGSDWPVSELATSYQRWVEVVDAVVGDATIAERRKLFHDNAVAFYRL
jgi:L-fuconolactonase